MDFVITLLAIVLVPAVCIGFGVLLFKVMARFFVD
tara:strand:+ start:100 stop:204 length:105 start_codon:yes stop_codon:yes gene_type:complete